MSVPESQTAFIAPDIAELAPLFPGYEFETLIAVGGMGAVYRAIQKSLDRTVAIKILPKEFSADASFCAGFEAEAKAMARLNHPNLIGVYDFGEVMGMLYIIMEYVPGKSLFHSAHGIAIDPDEVVRLVTGICSGLAHAHEHGIIHRDIKPSNILLDLNAQPKIGDFGLARPIERKIQEGEEIFGTPHYTAPEVVLSPHSVDSRADIFSVGVMIHELLTGRLPADDPRPASAIIHCDPRFDTIIRKASHRVPAARYPTAAKLAADLQNITISSAPKILQPPAPVIPSLGHSRPYVRPIASARKSSAGTVFVTMTAFALVGGAIYYTSRAPAPGPNIHSPENPVPAPNPPDNDLSIHSIPGTKTEPITQPETPPITQPETPPEIHPGTQPEIQSAVVLFDINSGNSATQPGWVAAPSGNGTNGTYTLTTIGVNQIGPEDIIQPRDRKTGNGGGDEVSMWGDSIYAKFSDTSNPTTGLQLTISGLAANTTYPITIWAFDNTWINTRVTTWATNAASGTTTFNPQSSPRPATLDDYALTINGTTDASGNLILTGLPHETGAPLDPNVFINGLGIGKPIPKRRAP